MGVTVTTAQNAGFIPTEVVAREALRVLRAKLGLMSFVRRDTDFSVPQGLGNTISIPYPGTFGALNKAAGVATTLQDPQGGTKVQVTLDKHRYVDAIIEDAARAFSNADLLNTYLDPMMTALAESVEADGYAALMPLTNTRGTAGTDASATLLRQANSDLNTRRIAEQPRMLFLTPKDEMALMGDSALQNYFAWAQANTVATGNAPQLYGFMPKMSQIPPVTGVYRLTFTGGNAAETFRLIWNGIVTADIAFNATAATLATNIQTALRALTDPIAVSTNVSCSGAGSGPWTVDITWSSTALYYSSAVVPTTQGVGGTAYTGTIGGAFNGTQTSNNFAIGPEALIFVPRPFLPTPTQTGREIVTVGDTESGLNFRMIFDYDRANRAVVLAIDMLYGVKKLRDAAGIRLIC